MPNGCNDDVMPWGREGDSVLETKQLYGKYTVGLGNRGKRTFISGEQRPNFKGNRGTKTILRNREHKKTNFGFLRNMGTGQFI